MFAQAKFKLPISSQKQNNVAYTTQHKKHTFPVTLTNLFYFCSCNMQIARFSQKQESIAHVQKRQKSCFTFCLKTNLDAEELCLNWSTQFHAHALQGTMQL